MTIQGRPLNSITSLEDKLQNGIAQIKLFIENTHVFFKEENKKYHEVLDKQFWPQEEEHLLWEAIKMIEQTGDFNPFFLNKSSFVLAFSFFEKCFRDTVNIIKREKGIKLSIDDLNGQDIEKAYKFLSKILDYDLDPFQSQWNKIKDYQKIRNSITHNFGEIPDDDKKPRLLQIISKYSYLEVTKETNELLIMNEAFVFDFCDTIDSFLMPILEDFR